MINLNDSLKTKFTEFKVDNLFLAPESTSHKITRIASKFIGVAAATSAVGTVTQAVRLGKPLLEKTPLNILALACTAIAIAAACISRIFPKPNYVEPAADIGKLYSQREIYAQQGIPKDQIDAKINGFKQIVLDEVVASGFQNFEVPENLAFVIYELNDADRASFSQKFLDANPDIPADWVATHGIYARLLTDDAFKTIQTRIAKKAFLEGIVNNHFQDFEVTEEIDALIDQITDGEKAGFSQKFIAHIYNPETPELPNDWVRTHTHYNRLLTPEAFGQVKSIIEEKKALAKHVKDLEKNLDGAPIADEINAIKERYSHAISYMADRNSREWRHYFYTIGLMIQFSSDVDRNELANALYAAVDPKAAAAESLMQFVQNFNDAEEKYEHIVNILKQPFPHGQHALNMAVAFGFIDLSKPHGDFGHPLLFALNKDGIAPEVFNRLLSIMRYHHIDINVAAGMDGTVGDGGNTLLHEAVDSGNLPLVTALVVNGADISLKNAAGITALNKARALTNSSTEKVRAESFPIYQTFMYAFTQWVAASRHKPIQVVQIKADGTPVAKTLANGKKAKYLKMLDPKQKAVGAVGQAALSVVDETSGFVSQLVKVGETQESYEKTIAELEKRRAELQTDSLRSSLEPQAQSNHRSEIDAINLQIDGLKKQRDLEGRNNYVDAAATGFKTLYTLMSLFPAVKDLAKAAVPFAEVADKIHSIWTNYNAADTSRIQKEQDEARLILAEQEAERILALRDSFAEDQFIYKLMDLKLKDQMQKRSYLQKRIGECQVKEEDAGIETRTAAVQVLAIGGALVLGTLAPELLMAGAIAGKTKMALQGLRKTIQWMEPNGVPTDNDFEIQVAEKVDAAYLTRCGRRLGLTDKELLNSLVEMQKHLNQNEEDLEWFLAILKESGILCDRDAFVKNQSLYLLRFILD